MDSQAPEVTFVQGADSGIYQYQRRLYSFTAK